jgi:parvulin-like peptidyl-prolyl isomerase
MPLSVNGEPVDDALIREEAASLRPRYFEMMEGQDPIAAEMQLREWSRENVVERVLLRQEAAKRQLSLEDLLARITTAVPPPKNKDVAELYRKNRESFWAPELVHAWHIVKNIDETHDEAAARAGIEQAEAELRQGLTFQEVADRLSDCPGNGGDLGLFPRGQMVPEFDAVVFALQPGQTSPIFRTPFGFHIARVTARKPEGIRTLAEMREYIENELLGVKRQKAVEDFVDELKSQADIKKT